MATNFPTSLDSYATLVDNSDDVLASHPNDRGDAIEALEAKVGVNSSAVTTSHDYKITNLQTINLNILMDGGSSTLPTGIQSDVHIAFAGTITQVTLLADQTGSMVIDIWKDTYANYPPTVADTITASSKPTISSSNKYQDSTLTGWTTSIAAGSILRINIDSVTNITRCVLSLKISRS